MTDRGVMGSVVYTANPVALHVAEDAQTVYNLIKNLTMFWFMRPSDAAILKKLEDIEKLIKVQHVSVNENSISWKS